MIGCYPWAVNVSIRILGDLIIWLYNNANTVFIPIKKSKGRSRSWFQLLDRSRSNDLWVVPSHQNEFKRFSRVRTLFNLALLS